MDGEVCCAGTFFFKQVLDILLEESVLSRPPLEAYMEFFQGAKVLYTKFV